MKFLMLFCLLPLSALAMELETPGYVIAIESQCQEGDVACQHYTYKGKSKKSGNTIELKGASWHTLCADGVTPCRFLGYQFKNGDVTYYVHDDGLLEVVQGGDKVLVRQQGEWRY
ncbi:nuclear transport factor 2 family protein [Litoribacillus peritrichatus]|uniref:Uncharacterized protein n=1 Tax=Litoribacillus peritrichatus TaxID=718191 RepID=A0ABP7MTN8_9GAMM